MKKIWLKRIVLECFELLIRLLRLLFFFLLMRAVASMRLFSFMVDIWISWSGFHENVVNTAKWGFKMLFGSIFFAAGLTNTR